MSVIVILLGKLLIGAILGLIISTTGVGGGVLVLPVLTYLFGLDALSAVATANLLSMLMKLSSTGMHFKLGNVPIKRSILILAIMLPSTLIASYGVTFLATIENWHNYVQFGINGLIVVTILLSLLIFCTRLFHVNHLQAETILEPRIRAFIIPGISAGLTIGATGVSGGVVMLPILIKYAGMNIKQAIGTSIFVTMMLSGASALAYGQSGYTDVQLALILAIGSIFSIPLAKYALNAIPERILQFITFGFILCSAIMMLYQLVNTSLS